MHRVVGVDLFQSQQQALHQVLSVLELNELESHLAADAHNDGIGQQARVFHLLNAHYLKQRRHTKYKTGAWQVRDHALRHMQEEFPAKAEKWAGQCYLSVPQGGSSPRLCSQVEWLSKQITK